MRETTRTAAATLAVGISGVLTALLALSFVSAAAQAQAGAQSGATVDQAGWWSRVNAVPDSPVPGVTLPPLTLPSPPSVPAGTMAVSVTAGQIDKVSAIGIRPELTDGLVERAILAVPEATAGEQIDNTGAGTVIVACPISEFWVAEQNGQWSNQPPNSCSTAKVPGQRSPDGVWTFDITSIASLWSTPGALAPNGVVLLPEVAAETGATFQVVFSSDPSAIGIDLVASPRTPPSTAAVPTTAAPSGGGTVTPGTTGTAAPATTAAPPPVATTQPAPAATTPTTDISNIDKILGNFPGGVFLLVPLVVALAFSLMVAFGPLGEPMSGVTREGGVSRALAARERSALDVERSKELVEAR